MAETPWQCPHCPKEIEDRDPDVVRIAVASHLKSHGKKPDGPRYAGGGKGSSKGGDGVLDSIGNAIGDIVGGIFD